MGLGHRCYTYTSPVIQNQIIDVLEDRIRSEIIRRVQKGKWFTMIADEVTDVSNKEQLSLVLRYIDPDTCLVKEDLVGFFECDQGISGQELASKITSCLQTYILDLSNLRGQAYDGAGNMACSVNGTAALIAAQYPLALYIHCASHCLNLAVVKSLQVTSVCNMMGVVDKVFKKCSAHPKRQMALERAISQTQPESPNHKLKDLCRTRWVQRNDGFEVFCSLYQSTVTCLESICNDGPRLWTSNSVTDARTLQLAITTTDFFSALDMNNFCLKYLQALAYFKFAG